jgi:hypothetical protein
MHYLHIFSFRTLGSFAQVFHFGECFCTNSIFENVGLRSGPHKRALSKFEALPAHQTSIQGHDATTTAMWRPTSLRHGRSQRPRLLFGISRLCLGGHCRVCT